MLKECDKCHRKWETFIEDDRFDERCPFCNQGFTLNEAEKELANKFVKKHRNCYKNNKSAIGGSFSYHFTPTGIGLCVDIHCNMCNEKKELTDFASW